MNKTLRTITFLFAAGMILASTGSLAPAQQSDPTLIVPFGRNKELAPAHDVYKFPYKENYIMLPLTNGKITEDGGMRVIVNKPIEINKRRTTVIPLGHGAPNISPTPVVPHGFNGGSLPQPVNRPEGVVVRRIYPQQEFVTSYESAVPQVRTYDEPPVVERTEPLPSVVLPENSGPVISPEQSIVYPTPAVPSETTPSTSVDGTQITPAPYEIPSETYTAPVYEVPAETPASEYEAPSETLAPSESETPSETPAPSESETPSGTSAPSESETPSGTSPDPYQSGDSSETSWEEETPTSAWRSTASNPAETYDSGMGESPMVMTQQESTQTTNPWETQSAKPQVMESVSPVVAAPYGQPAQNSQTSAYPNSASAPSGQTRYVEVRPRRQSANRAPQNRNSETSQVQVPAVSLPASQPIPQSAPQPSTQTGPQYRAPQEIPAQLPPPDPGTQAPKPSADGRKV